MRALISDVWLSPKPRSSKDSVHYAPAMSFFEDVGEFEEPKFPEPVHRPWFGPPDRAMPVSVPGNIVVFHNDQAALVLDHFNAFTTGLQFTLSLWLREPKSRSPRHYEAPWELHEGGAGPDDPEFLRLGIQFSDGSKWTNLPGPMAPFDEPPPGPVVWPQGGSSGGSSWTFQHWMWPLPPPGEMIVHASWPAHGVDETSVAIDTSEIADAASRSALLWPDDHD